MESKSVEDPWTLRAFKALDTHHKGYLLAPEILNVIKLEGVYTHHSLSDVIQDLEAKGDEQITFDDFKDWTQSLHFLKKVLEWDLTIPNFQEFSHYIEQSFLEIKEDPQNKYSTGKVATYIPPLANANPNWFATGFCTTDGQFCHFGDTDKKFSIQSISKIVTYAYVYDIMGESVHEWVGEEPSGQVFNAPVFDKKGKPHNPCVNAGAIMVCSLIIKKGKNINDIMEFYKRATNAPVVEVDH